MRNAVAAILFCVAGPPVSGQTFEVASVKVSRSIEGRDGTFTLDPVRLSARNVTMKRLVFEAWQIPYSQITGGPGWLNNDEYDIEAKADGPVGGAQLRLMLRALLVERFKLQVRQEKKEGRIYGLVVGKDGAKLKREPDLSKPRSWRFHGDLSQFANILAIQLTIPASDDPKTPSMARGTPIPVVNQTGIDGVYDIALDLKLEPGADAFTVWQRALEEQLGLRLESKRGLVDYLAIEHVERVPSGN